MSTISGRKHLAYLLEKADADLKRWREAAARVMICRSETATPELLLEWDRVRRDGGDVWDRLNEIAKRLDGNIATSRGGSKREEEYCSTGRHVGACVGCRDEGDE
jgi:hypothetical protein